RHVEVDEERAGAVALVLELTTSHLAWSGWQVRRQSLQRLHACHFVGAHRALPNLHAFWRGAIVSTRVRDLGVAIGFGCRATLTPASCTPRQVFQRRRHNPTASTSMGTRSAISVLLYPMEASSTTRARRTSAWLVLWAHTRRSSSWCSASINTISGGFGPGIHATLIHKTPPPNRPHSASG